MRCNINFLTPNVEKIVTFPSICNQLSGIINPHGIQNWLLKKSSIQLQNQFFNQPYHVATNSASYGSVVFFMNVLFKLMFEQINKCKVQTQVDSPLNLFWEVIQTNMD
jgi:hypothetical protein